MYSRFPTVLRGAGSLVVALGISTTPTAFAQEEAGAAAEPATQNQQQQPERYLEEVFVTVSKRTESVQEVSSAVSAFSAETLAENNVQDYATLADLTPGMITREEGNVTIRGIGKGWGGTSPVAFHVNGFFLENSGEPFYDLEAVEVLRGPSGTVYGRNATAGAINAKWRRPEDVFAAGADYRRANYDDEQIRGYLNAPLLEMDNISVLGRISLFKSKRQGYLDNELAPDDMEPNGKDEAFARAYITSQIGDNLRLGLQAIRFEADPPSGGSATPSLATRRSGLLEKFGAETMPDDLLVVRSTMFMEQPQPHKQFTRAVAEIGYSFDDFPFIGAMDVDLMLGQLKEKENGYTDLDGTEVAITEVIESPHATRRNGELRFTSQNDSGIDWIVGLFWYRSNWQRDMHVDARTEQGLGALFPVVEPLPLPNPIFDADVDFIGEKRVDKSEAVFLNLRADLATIFSGAPDIELFTGIRENRDALRLATEREVIIATEPTTGVSIPFEDTSTDVASDFSSTTGELGAKWFYRDEAMLYIKYAKGYKPGTVQLLAGEDDLNEVAPENLDMIEAGWKVGFFNRSLLLNLTAFHYDYTDLQVSKIIITGQKLENAGEAVIDGVEAEIQWAPNAQFFSQMSFGWLDARFNEFCGRDEELLEQNAPQPGCTEDEPHNFNGAKMSDSPEFSVSVLARYTFPIGDFGTLTPLVKFAWVDDYSRRSYGNPIDDVEGHTKTDLRLVWASPTEAYKVEAFVQNIEDHDELFSHHFSMPDPGAYSLLGQQPPRTAGVKFEANY